MTEIRLTTADSDTAIAGQDHVSDIVPLGERRRPLTLGLLWLTMVTGFPSVLVGFDWYKSGLTLTQVLQCVVLSCLVLLIYTVPAAYLGARSGQTYSLLSRQVFGAWGSRLVSANLIWTGLIWYGLDAIFLAQGLCGLYHIQWSVGWLAAGLAVLMAFNNFFGFTGIANFARYLAAPILIAWIGFTFSKVIATCPSSTLTTAAHVPFSQALPAVSVFVLGFSTWGNEADYWRYGRPRKLFIVIPLTISLLIGQILFPLTGWLMARLTGITDPAAATDLLNRYSFGGITIVAASVLIVTYVAFNDSNLYGCINGMENLKNMPRKIVVAIMAVFGATAAVILSQNTHAFELAGTISSVSIPLATVIMLAEFFCFSSAAQREAQFQSVPPFSQLPSVRWSAVLAIIFGLAVGTLTSGLIPGLEIFHVGICAAQSWLTSLVVYFVLRTVELRLKGNKLRRLANSEYDQ